LSFTDITYVQVSESLDLLVVPLGTAPSKIGLFFMPDANPDDSDVGDGTGRHLTVNYKPPIYIVIVYK
jgi:hypothetical protein